MSNQDENSKISLSNNNFQNDWEYCENDSQNYLLCSLNGINEEDFLKHEQVKLPMIKIKQKDVKNSIFDIMNEVDYYEQSHEEDLLESNQDEDLSNNESKQENNQDDSPIYDGIEKQNCQKTTEEINRITTTKARRPRIDSTIVARVEVKKRKYQNQQVETKNLPNYYGRHIIKCIKKKLEKEQNVQMKSEMKNKLDKFNRKAFQFTLKLLRDILDEQYFREAAIQYFTSFEFLDDLLQSDKQQDIRPQIKYVNRIFEGCYNRQKLLQWKDS